ncbi:arabinose metabolism transcriptional repressor-like [Saccostrea echinata]|uniref:arabinose metabolism transcriptional repressor-like n=1 Tax=Saccostrea echinata TaxID=191078 RepID=UPI002A818EDB|nr:arabinose metabolism transcriptional repressor-like [Saccostrea echinata]
MPKKRAYIVTDWVKGQIRQKFLQTGQRLPTEAELEKRLNISRNAVRNGLSQLAQQGWLTYQKNLGYFVSEAAKPLLDRDGPAASSLNIGLLCFFPGHYIFPEIIAGVTATIDNPEYNIIIKQSEYQVEQESLALESFLQQGIIGLIAEPVVDDERAPNLELYQQLAQSGIPIIFIDASVPQLRSSSILCHDLQSGRTAAETLLQLGYRQFVLFYQDHYLAKTRRIQGARAAFRQYRDVQFVELVFQGQGQHSNTCQQCEAFFARTLRHTGRPMAWICSNDEEAAIVISVAEHYGWELHRHYELIAFDNSQLSRLLHGGFSSFTHPGKLMGRMAARHLLDQLTEPIKNRHCAQVLVEPNFIQRNLADYMELKNRLEVKQKEKESSSNTD